MLHALLATIGTLAILASIVAKCIKLPAGAAGRDAHDARRTRGRPVWSRKRH